jgi:hypothetical protein
MSDSVGQKRKRFLLVDYENVQSLQLAEAPPGSCIVIFVGAGQLASLPMLLSASDHRDPQTVYRVATETGKNVLDFHLMFYFGVFSTQEVGAEFLILSCDTGYDPVLRHAGLRGIRCLRITTWSQAAKPFDQLLGEWRARSEKQAASPQHVVSNKVAKDDKLERIVEQLKKKGDQRPRKLKNLSNLVLDLCRKAEKPGKERDRILERLKVEKLVCEGEKGLIYQLDGDR